jgi:TPR repeat protein
LVGEAGRLTAIRFEGNRTFDREQLLWALKLDFDVQTAAHPLAPVSNYIAILEKKMVTGYRREGFPEATIHAALETNRDSVLIRVAEGPRYCCGEVQVKGTSVETNAAVLRSLKGTLVEFRQGEFDSVLWQKDRPAPFDAQGQEVLSQRIEATLADLGYFKPRFRLKIAPGTEKGRADLEMQFENAGTSAVLEEIQINDLFRNTRQQVLDFLKLKPGMRIQPNLGGEVTEKLWKSGRFFKHEVALSPLGEPGQFKLALKLDEVELAPPLDQPLSPGEEALLKFGERVRHWDSQPEDWVWVVDLPLERSRIQAELVMSSAGVAGVFRTGISNQPATIKAAGIVAERRIALYSPGEHRKIIWEPTQGYVPGSLKLTPPEHPFSEPVTYLGVSLNPSFTLQSRKLLDFSMDVAPVSFLCAAHYYECKVEPKQVTLVERDGSGATKFSLKLDAQSGRLLSAEYKLPRGVVQLRTEEAAFARLVNETTAAGVACSNVSDSVQGLVSWLLPAKTRKGDSSFRIEPEVLQDLNDLLGAQDPKSTWSEMRSRFAPMGTALAKIQLLLGGNASTEALQPLNSFWSAISKGPGDGSFHIPVGRSPTRSPTQQGMAPFAAAALGEADQLFPHGSWLWIAFRETILALEGAGVYTAQAIQQLRQSEEIGPAGCALIAGLVSRADSTEARLFARKGISLLSLEDFRRDYECLLTTNTVVGDTLRNVLALLQNLTPQQSAALASEAGSAPGTFLSELSGSLRASPGSVVESAWPVFERHWGKVIRPSLETALSDFLPKVNALTNSRALVERALDLRVSSPRTEQTRQEILDCLTKAAELGEAEAQYYLGFYYDREKQDANTALVWLEKAARQDYPHTGCRLGDIYSQGEKVPPDLDRSAEWYRREAEHDCAWAQFRFGRILMDRGNSAEGVLWYRRAAEGGLPQAMSALGEFYSDDLFNTPDYVEAYIWLRLVASRGDMPASVLLRRVRKKLSSEQVVEAFTRGVVLCNRIQANVKKSNAKVNQK